jgi:hypothetical protein
VAVGGILVGVAFLVDACSLCLAFPPTGEGVGLGAAFPTDGAATELQATRMLMAKQANRGDGERTDQLPSDRVGDKMGTCPRTWVFQRAS